MAARLNLYSYCVHHRLLLFCVFFGHMRACAVYSVYLFVCLLIITNSNSSTPNKNLISSTHCKRYKYRRDTNQDAKHCAYNWRESVAVCHHSRLPLQVWVQLIYAAYCACCEHKRTNASMWHTSKYDRMNKCRKLWNWNWICLVCLFLRHAFCESWVCTSASVWWAAYLCAKIYAFMHSFSCSHQIRFFLFLICVQSEKNEY